MRASAPTERRNAETRADEGIGPTKRHIIETRADVGIGPYDSKED